MTHGHCVGTDCGTGVLGGEGQRGKKEIGTTVIE